MVFICFHLFYVAFIEITKILSHGPMKVWFPRIDFSFNIIFFLCFPFIFPFCFIFHEFLSYVSDSLAPAVTANVIDCTQSGKKLNVYSLTENISVSTSLFIPSTCSSCHSPRSFEKRHTIPTRLPDSWKLDDWVTTRSPITKPQSEAFLS